MDFDDLIEDACQIGVESDADGPGLDPAPPDDFEAGFLSSAVASSNRFENHATAVNPLAGPRLVRSTDISLLTHY
jgi:hypothetical protein